MKGFLEEELPIMALMEALLVSPPVERRVVMEGFLSWTVVVKVEKGCEFDSEMEISKEVVLMSAKAHMRWV